MIWKLQTAIGADTLFPRDRMVMTPHFNDGGIGSDPQALCDDWAAFINGWTRLANSHQITVKAYDAQGSVPVYPEGVTQLNPAAYTASVCPREVALCLSFFSTYNVPRRRGRLYMPIPVLIAAGSVGLRPDTIARAKGGALAQAAQDLGGPDVDWCVYSKADNEARPVTDWYVDDEWDTIRSRGLRSTMRLTGTTSEA